MNWRNWATQVGIAIDQVANAILDGYADETLSSRSYRMWRDGKKAAWLMRVIDVLFFWQAKRPEAVGHCHNAYLNERERLGLPPEMRLPN